jgi:phosphate/sulfate permease
MFLFLTPGFLLMAGIFAGILMAFSIGSNDVANGKKKFKN